MAIAVRGHQQLRKYQRALGGEPRQSALRKAKAEMARYVAETRKNGNESWKRINTILANRRDLYLGQIYETNPYLKAENAELRRLLEQRAKRKLSKPRLRKIEPSIVTDTAILTPPYDGVWVNNSNAHQIANASAANGTYNLVVQSLGDGNHDVSAGLVSHYLCTESGLQRFAATIDFSDDWWDSAMGYVAHNYVSTRLWVYGEAENTWVVQTEVQPSWSDGVSWFEKHGNDPNGETGGVAVETFFQGQANNWYQGWVWTDAQADSDSGVLGMGASSIHFSASIPAMLFT